MALLRNVVLAGAWVVALVVLLDPAVAGPGSAENPIGRASFAYEGQLHFEGAFEGSCEGRGVEYTRGAPGTLVVQASEARVIVREVHLNSTRIDQYWILHELDWNDHTETTSGGALLASWPDDGRATVYPYGYYDYESREGPFRVEFNASSISATGVDTGGRAPGDVWVEVTPGAVGRTAGAFAGPSRPLVSDRGGIVTGNLSIHLAHPTIQFPNGQTKTYPPWLRVDDGREFLVGEQRHETYTDVWLDVMDARLAYASDRATAICGPIDAIGDGTWTVARATGHATIHETSVDFTGKVVAVGGEVRWTENAPPQGEAQPSKTMAATVDGTIRTVAIDFEAYAATIAPVTLPVTAKVAGWASLITVTVAWLTYKAPTFVGMYYARFGPERVLGHAQRRRIIEQVTKAPGLSLKSLAVRLGTHRSTVRYHAEVLARNQMIHFRTLGRSVRVWPGAKLNGEKTRADALLTEDERVAFVVDLIRGGPRALSYVAAKTANRFNVTRRSARRIVKRAESAGLIERSQPSPVTGAVVIRCRAD